MSLYKAQNFPGCPGLELSVVGRIVFQCREQKVVGEVGIGRGSFKIRRGANSVRRMTGRTWA